MEIEGYTVRNGVETCEDKCKCGANLRLHTFIFGANTEKPDPKFYVDCPRCASTSNWKATPSEAIEEFDKENVG